MTGTVEPLPVSSDSFFLDTRVLSVAIPYHRNFEEVNLRFYVRRKSSDGWRRAVVFVKELVPRVAIAWVARAFYGENYVALPMQHSIGGENCSGARTVSYSWWFHGAEHKLHIIIRGKGKYCATGTAEEFITEHYWGYARRRDGRTTEYRVEHPRWRVITAEKAGLDCDVAEIYGDQFVEFLQTPSSAFLADGSDVTVSKGTLLPS